MNDIICGDQSTNAGTEQTEYTKYDRNKDVNGTLRMLEPSPLPPLLVSACKSTGPSIEKVKAVVVAIPAARMTLPAPRRDNLRGCTLRKWWYCLEPVMRQAGKRKIEHRWGDMGVLERRGGHGEHKPV